MSFSKTARDSSFSFSFCRSVTKGKHICTIFVTLLSLILLGDESQKHRITVSIYWLQACLLQDKYWVAVLSSRLIPRLWLKTPFLALCLVCCKHLTTVAHLCIKSLLEIPLQWARATQNMTIHMLKPLTPPYTCSPYDIYYGSSSYKIITL